MKRHTQLILIALFSFLVGCNSSADKTVVTHDSVGNPVLIHNLFPEHGLTDPHVWIENGKLYLFGGHDQSWFTNDTWKMDRWEIWSTADLKTWQLEHKILPTETYIGNHPNCWAGDIVERDSKYYWYFSNRSDDTGVMIADKITGAYTDALGEPLLPEGLIKGHCYDPEIVIDNGKYYIIFSAGIYHIAELAGDMISLATEPTPLNVVDKEGNRVWTDDKSCMFIKDDIYYLVWGDDYATSTSIMGTYTYQGAFLAGGHSSVFEWDGTWYVVQENKDLSLFYRGISLKPIAFNPDGTIIVPDSDYDYPGKSRQWCFSNSEMGWRAVDATTLAWNEKGQSIVGEVTDCGAAIESCTWLLNATLPFTQLTVTIKNNTPATQMKAYIASYSKPKGKFWEHPEVAWENEWSKTVAISPHSDEFITYTFDIEAGSLEDILKTIRIEPITDVTNGEWEITDITIE